MYKGQIAETSGKLSFYPPASTQRLPKLKTTITAVLALTLLWQRAQEQQIFQKSDETKSAENLWKRKYQLNSLIFLSTGNPHGSISDKPSPGVLQINVEFLGNSNMKKWETEFSWRITEKSKPSRMRIFSEENSLNEMQSSFY